MLATSDVPAGVVNLLTGPHAEIAPWLASHLDVDGLDLTGVEDPELARNLEIEAAVNLKRVRRAGVEDLAATPGLDRMTRFLETKTSGTPPGPEGARTRDRPRRPLWSGKSRLTRRLGLPELRPGRLLQGGRRPTLPRLRAGGESIVDWGRPGSWDADAAGAALETLCRTGSVEVPVYDIATSAVTGRRTSTWAGPTTSWPRASSRPSSWARAASVACWPTPCA